MSIRLLSRDFAFYGLLDFLQRASSILLVPIYTRVLTQSSFGNLDLMLTACSILTILVDLQFVAGFSRLYLERRRSGEGAGFAGTAILTAFALGSLIAVTWLSLGFAGLLEVRFLPSFLSHRREWVVATGVIPFAFAYDLLLTQAQLLRRKGLFFAGAFGNTLTMTVLSIVLTTVIPLGILGVVLGQFLSRMIFTVVLFAGLRGEILMTLKSTLLKELVGYALPLVPGRWVGHSSAYVSRFFIFGGMGARENAVLAITTKFAAALGLFCIAFRNAWQPLAMGYIGDRGSERFYVRSLRLFMAGGIFSTFALTALAGPVLAILAPGTYGSAQLYVPLFLVAGIIAELDVNLQLGNQIARKTYWMSVAALVAFGVNVLVLATLTSRLGIYAAGTGLLVAFSLKAFITYRTAQKSYAIPYDRVSLALFVVSCAVLLILFLARVTGFLTEPVFLAQVIVCGLTFPILIAAPEDRAFLWRAAVTGTGALFGRASRAEGAE